MFALLVTAVAASSAMADPSAFIANYSGYLDGDIYGWAEVAQFRDHIPNDFIDWVAQGMLNLTECVEGCVVDSPGCRSVFYSHDSCIFHSKACVTYTDLQWMQGFRFFQLSIAPSALNTEKATKGDNQTQSQSTTEAGNV